MKSDTAAKKMGVILQTITLLIVVLGLNDLLVSQVETGYEYELKATFIYNFTKYIQWPNIREIGSFRIGVLGDSPIIASLDEIAKKKTVYNKEIIIKRINKREDIQDCQIIFISASIQNELETILKEIGNAHILTIADSEGMAKKGIATNFIIRENKIKFEMNIRAIQRADLVVSSQLKKLAIMVEEET